MCSKVNMFSTYEPLHGLCHYITIPDGTKVEVQHIGTVLLRSNIVLHYVLQVPGF